MRDVCCDGSAEQDLDSCQDGDGDEGEEEGVEYSLQVISTINYDSGLIGTYKALRTGYLHCLLRSPGFRFLHRF